MWLESICSFKADSGSVGRLSDESPPSSSLFFLVVKFFINFGILSRLSDCVLRRGLWFGSEGGVWLLAEGGFCVDVLGAKMVFVDELDEATEPVSALIWNACAVGGDSVFAGLCFAFVVLSRIKGDPTWTECDGWSCRVFFWGVAAALSWASSGVFVCCVAPCLLHTVTYGVVMGSF